MVSQAEEQMGSACGTSELREDVHSRPGRAHSINDSLECPLGPGEVGQLEKVHVQSTAAKR